MYSDLYPSFRRYNDEIIQPAIEKPLSGRHNNNSKHYTHSYSHTDKQIVKQTYRHTDKQIVQQTYRHTDKQIVKQTYRHTDKQIV